MKRKRNFLTYYILLFFVFLSSNHSVSYAQENDTLNYIRKTLLSDFLKEYGIKSTDNNNIEIYDNGHDKFENLFDDIRKAKHHVHLEYFNFRNDSIANALFDLLAEKKKEGVEIRAIFDAFGNISNNRPLKEKHLKKIKVKGIEIKEFDPIRFPWINHVFKRDHRKIAIIDGKIGYTGGMNIADYYIKGLPKIGPWHDMHIRIEGDAVKDLQKAFLEIWNKETKQNIGGNQYYPTINESEVQGGVEMAIINRVPNKTPKIMREMYTKAINSAKSNIQIINPYFVPTHSIKAAIKEALKRGVNVEIMVPGKSDIPFTPDATYYISNKLRKKGANIYIYNNGFHHSKVMMVDSIFCTIGSTNLNSRSLRYDFEVNALIFDKKQTNKLNEIFERDKQNSTLLTKQAYKKRGLWKHLVGWFANLMTPFL